MTRPARLDEQPIAAEGRTLRTIRRHREHIELDRQLARIAIETNTDLPTPPSVTRATLPGDKRRLRGIPVVGARGVGGAIPGSRPGDGLE